MKGFLAFIGFLTLFGWFLGSDKNVKMSVQFKCVDGVLLADSYLGKTSENVVLDKFKKKSNEVIFIEGFDIICKKKGE